MNLPVSVQLLLVFGVPSFLIYHAVYFLLIRRLPDSATRGFLLTISGKVLIALLCLVLVVAGLFLLLLSSGIQC